MRDVLQERAPFSRIILIIFLKSFSDLILLDHFQSFFSHFRSFLKILAVKLLFVEKIAKSSNTFHFFAKQKLGL
jgi:hypothetical protein